jgi:hypothetical protein
MSSIQQFADHSKEDQLQEVNNRPQHHHIMTADSTSTANFREHYSPEF